MNRMSMDLIKMVDLVGWIMAGSIYMPVISGFLSVDIVIMIAVSDEGKGEFHLQLLSKLSRLMMHEDFRNELKNGTKDQVYETLMKNLEVE